MRTDLGGQAYYKFNLGKTVVIPTVKVAWEHEFNYSSVNISGTAPALDNATATFFGSSEGRNSLIINAGLSLQINPRLWITLGYDGQQGRGHYNANGVNGLLALASK